MDGYYSEQLEMTYGSEEIEMANLDALLPELMSMKDATMNNLSNVDYSLNSPLISDEIDEFLRFVRMRYKPVRWSGKLWGDRLSGFGACFSPTKIIPSKDWHSSWAKMNLNPKFNQTDFSLLFRVATDAAKITAEIPQAFFEGWLGTKPTWTYSHTIPSSIEKWGHLFWELHTVILILNAVSREEVVELQGTTKCRDCSPAGNIMSQSLNLPNFGQVILSWGFVWFKELGWVLDRNSVLMMKDTYIARFHTLLSMYQRCDNEFGKHGWEVVNTLYKLGDEILAQSGVPGYKALKLLEPICNLRLTELARSHRPLIPEFPNFKLHIQKSLSELKTSLRVNGSTLYRHIMLQTDLPILFAIFSSFRHWGHPYIDYVKGLEKLHKQVTLDKDIDPHYVNILASDLAFIVLESTYQKTQKWSVDLTALPQGHCMRENILSSTWPDLPVLEKMEGHWHELPLTKVFDIPDLIDPSAIYSDKSHSLTRSELRSWMKLKPGVPIPTHKVLSTLLSNPATNWPEFLKKVNDYGLELEHLIIGLKAKEREIKEEGRFFSLMSWALREYFVITEYLIKEFFVPLFSGLTMADDLTTVIKKMLNNTIGQGGVDYQNICIANHFDYEKWNNHQRKESNNPVFRVMGQFLGYPELICRTHEFFEKSWIYYNDRPDMFTLQGDSIICKSGHYAWNGQAGGLEGLRQKGWSILNLLVIRRESLLRNTKVKVLAQGDNQVIFTSYSLNKHRDQEELISNINAVVQNNQSIIDLITKGTKKLGLLINHDETIQSADYMIYGKIPAFRGNLQNLETKRWSRVTCVSNDQLPTLASIMSSVVSNALTVSQYAHSPKNPIYHYNLIGNLAYEIIRFHDPAVRGPLEKYAEDRKLLRSIEFRVLLLYLDPSLGGVSGVSLTRFLIRMFPDPITEALSFWKKTYPYIGHTSLRRIIERVGNPRLATPSIDGFSKLMEDPSSLNIRHGISSTTLIKNLIRSSLFRNLGDIKNEIIKDAASHCKQEEPRLLKFLYGVRPVFPRFLAEYKASTYLGITDSLIGLFENSKTIRNQFKRYLSRSIDKVITKCELAGVGMLLSIVSSPHSFNMWVCSTRRAQELRYVSWGVSIHGSTVPHPIELLGYATSNPVNCRKCSEPFPSNLFIALLFSEGLANYRLSAGPFKAYLGSTTSETTSILQPWDRETKIPVIKRAAKLRDSIGWFVDPDSNLASTIYQNLASLTGEDWSGSKVRGKKSGSALHRYRTSRLSAGGYTAQNPSKLTRMILTTNTMSSLGDTNYNFIFQSLLLYAQMTAGEMHDGNPSRAVYHLHVNCTSCIKEISEITLENKQAYQHPDVSSKLNKWKPTGSNWSTISVTPEIPIGDWSSMDIAGKSWAVGVAEGFVFTDLGLSKNRHAEDSSIFPLSLAGKLKVSAYMMGLMEGALRATVLYVATRAGFMKRQVTPDLFWGSVFVGYKLLASNAGLINIWRGKEFEHCFRRTAHKIPAQYPPSDEDISRMGMTFFRVKQGSFASLRSWHLENHGIWIFSDINTANTIGCLAIAGKIFDAVNNPSQGGDLKEKLRVYRNTMIQCRTGDFEIDTRELFAITSSLRFVNREIRHSMKEVDKEDPDLKLPTFVLKSMKWTPELVGYVHSTKLDYMHGRYIPPDVPIVQIQNPLISGLRTFQCATGAHYKVRSILTHFNFPVADALVGGDGSGGIGSSVLRQYPNSRLIFNSLLVLDNVHLRGSDPGPPSAIQSIPEIRDRCVNLTNSWYYSSDLSQGQTWDYFRSLIKEHGLNVNLVILDMEVVDHSVSDNIEYLLGLFATSYPEVCIIYKTYLSRLMKQKNVLTTVGKYYRNVYLTTTQLSSSQTSEIYVVMTGLHMKVNHLQTPIVTKESLVSIKLPCLMTLDQELDRAFSLKTMNMLKGVPDNLYPQGLDSMRDLLDLLGVKANLAYVIMQNLGNIPDKNHYLLSFPIMILIFQGIVDTNNIHSIQQNPPSNSKVESIGCFIIAHLLWYGWVKEEKGIIKAGLAFLNHVFPFTWREELIRHKGTSLYKNTWTLRPAPGVSKYLHLDHKMALIGHIIRTLRVTFPRTLEGVVPRPINEVLKRVYSRMTWQTFNSMSGVVDLYQGAMSLDHLSGHPGDLSYTISDSSVFREKAWTS
ncbi:RNA-dependent RNA polymerase [Drosophila immigrans sigmavirus]|uniref:Replicase n=1 Tax=Drosophila immigrans sigmavirus TaxID=1002360 RepID=A0A1L3KMZ7_9RHAB|nr:RNA-dependent RNA polymerase [Drosophila immigrans sigmavirus]APG78762.1 RNA-dependent RNA polymerase [Drosophila immigrans sigmavirus]